MSLTVAEVFTNNASTTVVSGGSTAPAPGTVEAWTVTSAASFPTASASGTPPTQFHIVDPAAQSEQMLVTVTSGTSWTVTRGVEGTTPLAHSAGFTIRHIVVASTHAKWSQARDVFNVLNYGADPTGASDSAAAFQAAIGAAYTNGGGTVLIPGGSYAISVAVYVRQNVTISAYGAYIFTTTASAGLLSNYVPSSSPTVYTGEGNINVLGGIWDNKGQTYGPGGASCDTVYFGHASNITCRDMICRNAQFFHHIEMNSTEHGQVINCRFEGSYQGSGTVNLEAVQIDVAIVGAGLPSTDNTMSRDILVQGCYAGPAIDGSGLAAPGWVVAAHSAQGTQEFQNIRIIGNEAKGCIYGGIHAYTMSKITITDNVLVDCLGPGIVVEPQGSGYTPTGVVVGNNAIDNCTTYGISIAGVASGVVSYVSITGNTINNIQSPSAGISCQRTNNLTITGNNINNSGVGFLLGVCVDIALTGNTATNCTYGIDAVTCQIFNYSANTFDTCSNVGIYCSAGANGNVTGNTINNATTAAIQSPSGCTSVLCSGNKIIQGANGTQGILIQSTSTGWSVYGNDVSNGTWTLANALNLVAGTIVTPDGQQGVRGTNVWGTSLNPQATFASLASFTAEAVVATLTIPANDAVAGGNYTYRFYGKSAMALATNYTVRVRLGGLTGQLLLQSTAAAAAATGAWGIEGSLHCVTTGAGGIWTGRASLTASIWGAASQQWGLTTPTVAVDTTVAETIVVTFQSSVSNAGNTAQGLSGTLSRVY